MPQQPCPPPRCVSISNAHCTGLRVEQQIAHRCDTHFIRLNNDCASYAELATLVEPVPIPPTILADPGDGHVLACALAADAELIASGDKHLLGLGAFKDIEIITAVQTLERIAK